MCAFTQRETSVGRQWPCLSSPLLKKRKIPIDEATSRLFLQGLSLAYWPAVKTSGATCTGAPIMLIVFAGLPASGKSSIARVLAQELGAVWLRIDSIEQAIRESGAVPGITRRRGL
jgi:hypothetical protein